MIDSNIMINSTSTEICSYSIYFGMCLMKKEDGLKFTKIESVND
jgi:hypothetical protein